MQRAVYTLLNTQRDLRLRPNAGTESHRYGDGVTGWDTIQDVANVLGPYVTIFVSAADLTLDR